MKEQQPEHAVRRGAAEQNPVEAEVVHSEPRAVKYSAVFWWILEQYRREGMVLGESLEEFAQQVRQEIVQQLSPEERLRGLTPEQRLEGLTREQIEEYLRRLRGEQPPPSE
jgi:hypothetical protein